VPGDDDHRNVGVDPRGHAVGGPDAVEQVQAVALLQPQVQQDERRMAHLDLAHALSRAGGAGHREAVGGQVLGEEVASGVVVFDDQQ